VALELGQRDIARAAVLPGAAHGLFAPLVASCEFRFAGPFARQKPCDLSQHIGRIGERPRPCDVRNGEVSQARDHAWQALHTGLQGLAEV